MKMVRLGELIELSDLRNTDNKLTLEDVRGVSIEKKFIPTKANMEGVPLYNYKVVKPSWFCYVTVTSRNGGKISLAFQNLSKNIIVSTSYEVFHVKDVSKILPEYLFMLFNRSEFDRYSRFNSWGSARETFDFSELCLVKIPLPSIETQREIVAAYNGLKKVIDDNLAIAEPLEKLCQSFVSEVNKEMPHGFGTANADAFKFKDFALAKSNPRGNIKKVLLDELIEQCDERNSNEKLKIGDVMGISTAKEFITTKANMEGVPLSSYKIVNENDFAYVADTSRRGDKIALAYNNFNKKILISSIYTTFRIKDTNHLLPEYLFLIFNRSEFDRYSRFNSWGSARETFDWAEFCRIKIPLPPIDVQRSIVNIYNCAQEAKRIASEAKEELKKLCPALVQFAAHSA